MRHLISPSYSLRSKQKYLVQKGRSLSTISRGLARAAETAGQAVGQTARTIQRSRGVGAARDILESGAGSGVRLRLGVQGLSRRQADLVRGSPRQLARKQTVAQARGRPPSSISSLPTTMSWREASRVPSSISTRQSSRIAGMPRIEYNIASRIQRHPAMGIAAARTPSVRASTLSVGPIYETPTPRRLGQYIDRTAPEHDFFVRSGYQRILRPGDD